MSVGEHSFVSYTEALKDPKQRHWAKELATKLRCGYVRCATMLLEKLPLTNKTIIRPSCLHPEAYNEENFPVAVTNLAKSLPNVVSKDKLGALNTEAGDFSIDRDVKTLATKFNNNEHRIDRDFWAKVFQLPAYPVLSRLVKALLSIFTGPLVEASFNLMDDTIRADRTRLLTENYEACAIVKSSLKAEKVKASTMTIEPEMATFINTSKARYVKYARYQKEKHQKVQQQKLTDALDKLSAASKKKGRQTIRCGPGPVPATSSSDIATTAAAPISHAPASHAPASHVPASHAPASEEHVIPSSSNLVACSTDSSDVRDATATQKTARSRLPKGGKRAALKGTSDIRQFIKRPRLDE